MGTNHEKMDRDRCSRTRQCPLSSPHPISVVWVLLWCGLIDAAPFSRATAVSQSIPALLPTYKVQRVLERTEDPWKGGKTYLTNRTVYTTANVSVRQTLGSPV